ncbi:MAG: YiiX family permuted papain-like enzyme [Flavobacteriales bacterium]
MMRTLLASVAFALWSDPAALAQGAGTQQAMLRNGDIIFQTSRSGQSEAIALATGSPWTHVGVLFLEKEWLVLEAIGPVRTIPLERWIAQGEGGRYAVKRLDPQHGNLSSEALSAMRQSGKGFLGRPYDDLFLWDDERIYCSELVWKIYAEGAGIRLCAPASLREFSLEHPVVERTMKQRYGTAIPWDEPVVAPSSLFDCPMLVTVPATR